MNIYESITKIMSEGYSIGKDKKNPQQGYKYRGIDDVMNVFQPLLAKYKVFLVPEVVDHRREERTTGKGTLLIYSVCTMKYTFYAEDGSCVSAVVVGEGMDSGDKATNKAMSVAMKYAMFQVFCIPTEEMHDSEEDSPEPLPKKLPQAEVTRLQMRARETGYTEDKWCSRYKKSKYEDLTPEEEDDLLARMKKAVESKKEKTDGTDVAEN